jgi:hypothetical protein
MHKEQDEERNKGGLKKQNWITKEKERKKENKTKRKTEI